MKDIRYKRSLISFFSPTILTLAEETKEEEEEEKTERATFITERRERERGE